MLVFRIYLIFYVPIMFAACSAANNVNESREARKAVLHPTLVFSSQVGSFEIFGVKTGVSSLEDVNKVFSKGIVQKIGEAGLRVNSLCYVGHDGSKLTFESGEMGGEGMIVSKKSLSTSTEADIVGRDKDICSKSTLVNKSIMFSNGIGLDRSVSWFQSEFGKPGIVTKEGFSYITQVRSSSGGRNMEILSEVHVRTHLQKVVEISVLQVAEYF